LTPPTRAGHPPRSNARHPRQNNAHYVPLFSRFKADVCDGSVRFETQCLAYELDQIPDIPESALVLDAG